MRWRLILEDFTADALSCLGKIENSDYANSNNNNDKVEPTLESLSENFSLNKEDVLCPTSFKTLMRFQLQDKSLIVIAMEKP